MPKLGLLGLIALLSTTASGVTLTIERDGDCVTVSATGTPPCSYLQSSTNLVTWENFLIFNLPHQTNHIGDFQMSVKATEHWVFWRMLDCRTPQ
jgi:hypothetical protein